MLGTKLHVLYTFSSHLYEKVGHFIRILYGKTENVKSNLLKVSLTQKSMLFTVLCFLEFEFLYFTISNLESSALLLQHRQEVRCVVMKTLVGWQFSQ